MNGDKGSKKTAKNSELLRKAKRCFGPTIFRRVSAILNDSGEQAARDYLAGFMPTTLDEYLDEMGDLYDNMKEWPK